MAKYVFRFSLLAFLLRVGLTVFIGFHAPWYVTALAVLLQVQVKFNR